MVIRFQSIHIKDSSYNCGTLKFETLILIVEMSTNLFFKNKCGDL